MFDLVVCQADKQVVCDPSEAGGSGKQKSANTCRVKATSAAQAMREQCGQQKNACRVKATFLAQAVCTFSPELWNLGGTCIKNHVHGDKHPQCADNADKKLIHRLSHKRKGNTISICRRATDADHKFCTRLSVVY